MVTSKLKPCPFCGGEAILIEPYESWFRVVCKGCGMTTEWCEFQEEATKSWNTRAYEEKNNANV